MGAARAVGDGDHRLHNALGPRTVAWISSVCGFAVLTVPTVQSPVDGVIRPLAGRGRDERQARGSRSVTTTFVALSGPMLVSVTVKRDRVADVGRGVVHGLGEGQVGCCGVSMTLAVLLAVSGRTGRRW